MVSLQYLIIHFILIVILIKNCIVFYILFHSFVLKAFKGALYEVFVIKPIGLMGRHLPKLMDNLFGNCLLAVLQFLSVYSAIL